jgi:hypothetical protein
MPSSTLRVVFDFHPELPVVVTETNDCMDESSKQLVGEVRQPIEVQPGQVRRMDSEYERKGTCNLFMFFEPLRGWRHVWVTDQRRKVEWAHCIKELLAKPIRQISLYDIVTDRQPAFDNTVLSPGDAAEIAMRKDFPKD